jgi:CDP-diacylglycerol--glycerol-3-phosphate 3-phosphatidyltransferase
MQNKNIPNILTFSRIVIIPILIASFYIEGRMYHWVAASLFLLASVTDFFDGYLARTWKATSNLGRFLDPIADKLLVAAAILMLVHFEGIGRYDIIPAIAILCREIMVSGLREFLAQINVSVPVSNLSKIKTFVQMAAIFLLLLGNKGSMLDFVDYMGKILLWIAAILTIFTGYSYFKSYVKNPLL